MYVIYMLAIAILVVTVTKLRCSRYILSCKQENASRKHGCLIGSVALGCHACKLSKQFAQMAVTVKSTL